MLDTIPSQRLLGSPRETFARNRTNGGLRSAGVANAAGRPLSRAQEVVGEHHTANRGGVWRSQGLQHISTSVPTGVRVDAGRGGGSGTRRRGASFATLAKAASWQDTLTPRSSEALLWLRFTLSQACELRGSTCWLLEVLEACILCFDGTWIAMGDWNMEPKDLAQAGWARNGQRQGLRPKGSNLSRRSGRSFSTTSCCLRRWHIWVQQVEVVDNSPTTPHSPVSLTLTATSWGHRVLARKRPKPFPHAGASGDRDARRSILIGPGQQKQHGAGSTTSAGPNARPFLEGSKGLVIEHVSLGQATRNDTRRRCSKKGGSMAGFSSLCGAGGRQSGRMEEGASFPGYAATVSQFARFNPVTRSWPLGPRLGFPVTRSCGTFFPQSCNLWGLAAQVTRVMVFVKLHTQQAVNAAAADSARCWRQWAKEACQSSAGAAHGFSKVGLDAGDGEGLAGPQLWVNQMGTWLPLWLDPRRANAKQLADQEDMGEPLPRPSLEDVDNVCKTYKHTEGLGHDCINPKAILQLPVDLRVRFIDLLMMFEAKLVKPLNWSHMMFLRPQAIRRSPHNRPHGGSAAGLVAASKAAGAAAGERARCALFLGLSRQSVRPCGLGPLHHGGGGKGAAAIRGFLVT